MRGLLLRKCVFELTTPQCHGGIFQHFWSTDQKINFSTTVSTWKSILESPTIKRVLFRGMGIFSQLEQFESFFWEKGEPYMEYKRMSCQERNGQLCKFCEKDETTSAPLPPQRPYPDHGKLPNFHISLGVQPPQMAVSQTTFSLELRLSDCLRKVN